MQREFSEFMETITHSSPDQRWYSLVCTALLCQFIVPEMYLLSCLVYLDHISYCTAIT